jgi:hypothetical protein
LSHVVTIKTEVRDQAAIAAACQRLDLVGPREGTHKLFTSTETGLAVQLPGWKYPTVCKLESGELRYDNYNGNWGDQRELDRFLQAYAVEKAKLEARKKGYSVVEQHLPDQSIKLTINVGSTV